MSPHPRVPGGGRGARLADESLGVGGRLGLGGGRRRGPLLRRVLPLLLLLLELLLQLAQTHAERGGGAAALELFTAYLR